MLRGRAVKRRRRSALAVRMNWICQLATVLVALWWPALLSDPIYTSRQTRLAGPQVSLPDGAVAQTAEERALAIFWMWKHRTLAQDPWLFGPRRGLRDVNGRAQTLMVIAGIWLVRAGVFVWQRYPAHSGPLKPSFLSWISMGRRGRA